MKKILLTCILLISAAFSSFAQNASPIGQEQAIVIAQQYALEQGIRPAEWFGGEVDVMVIEGDWIVSFEQKPKDYIWITGDTFAIVIAPDGTVLKVYGGL